MASLASTYSSAVVTLWVTCASRSRAPSAVPPPASLPEPFVAGPGTPAGVSQGDVSQLRAEAFSEPPSSLARAERLQKAIIIGMLRVSHLQLINSLISVDVLYFTPTAHTQAWA